MKQSSTLFLKFVILLIALVTLTGLIWFPQLDGRNVGADFATIYLRDPFLIYIYVAFLPFFAALYQALKLLGHIEQNKAFSQTSVNALRNIKYSAMTLAAFILGAEAYLFIAIRGKDDIAGGAVIGFVIIFASTVIATAAAVFQKLLQNAVDIKSENDLTV